MWQLEWPVDQHGYELVHEEGEPEIIKARGGPPRYYRPMKIEGLWRRFADQCLADNETFGCVPNREGILAFVNEFGLLAAKPQPSLLDQPPVRGLPTPNDSETFNDITGTALTIREIIDCYNRGDCRAAADLCNNSYDYPNLTAFVDVTKRKDRLQLQLVPNDLRGVFLLQTINAITGNSEWRRCRNDGCLEWFRIGTGASTKRREFCSTRCRVADGERRRKTQEAQQ